MSRRSSKKRKLAHAKNVPPTSRGTRVKILLVALLAGLVAFAYQRLHLLPPPLEAAQFAARKAIARGDFEEALFHCETFLKHDSTDPKILLLAADAATRLDRLEDARGFYDRVPDSAVEDAAFAHCAVGTILFQQGRLALAEHRLRKSLQLVPDYPEAESRLATLLALEGRRWESLPHLLTVLELGAAGFQELAILGNADQTLEEEAFLKRSLSVAPTDVEPKLGLARIAHDRGETVEARSFLVEVIRHRPSLVEAHARLGLLLAEHSPADLPAWNAALPTGAEAHPDIWLVRGRWARACEQTQLAASCFWEAASRHPNRYAAIYELVQSLKMIDTNLAAIAPLTERAEQLLILKNLFEQIWHDRENHQLSRRIATILETLGRPWEAVAWLEWNTHVNSHSEDAQREIDRVVAVASKTLSPRVTFFQLPVQIDLTVQSPIDWEQLQIDGNPTESATFVRFHDSAAEVGINFQYFNSPDPATEGMRMFEFTGGGVAVLDFDADG